MGVIVPFSSLGASDFARYSLAHVVSTPQAPLTSLDANYARRSCTTAFGSDTLLTSRGGSSNVFRAERSMCSSLPLFEAAQLVGLFFFGGRFGAGPTCLAIPAAPNPELKAATNPATFFGTKREGG